MQWLIGIDEAGRGPLAGPVSVGAVKVLRDFDFSRVSGARDSKKMTEKAREHMYATLCALRHEGALDFAVSFSSAKDIDERGIVPAIRSALASCLEKLNADPTDCEVRLDGSLHAGEEFRRQSTIIRGDDLEPIISCASIVAKVERDRYMVSMAPSYAAYGFEVHKGYGTARHRAQITALGLSDLHRASFCTRLVPRA